MAHTLFVTVRHVWVAAVFRGLNPCGLNPCVAKPACDAAAAFPHTPAPAGPLHERPGIRVLLVEWPILLLTEVLGMMS